MHGAERRSHAAIVRGYDGVVRAVRWAVVSFVLAAPAACSAVLGLTDPRVDDGVAVVPPSEGGPPPPGPPPPGPPPPAPLEAGPDAARFCATQDAAFCDDFDDDDASVTARWPGFEVLDAGGTAAISSTSFTSAPHGAVFHENAVGASKPTGLRLAYYQVGVVPFGCELEFQPLALSTTGADGSNVLVAVVAPMGQGATTRLEVYLVVGPTGALHAEIDPHPTGSASMIPFTKTSAAPGRFTHLAIRADATGVTMSADGETLGPVPHGFAAPVTYDLYVGAHAFQPASGSTGWTFAYDDVLCR